MNLSPSEGACPGGTTPSHAHFQRHHLADAVPPGASTHSPLYEAGEGQPSRFAWELLHPGC